MKSPHILPALIALLLMIGSLLGGVIYAQALERRYIHALAPQDLEINLTGSALQNEAFRQPDLLPVYGSSEISNNPTEYSAQNFFSTYPTGFAPFEVAKGGMTSLNLAQHLAAVGSNLTGKKVVISFTPTMFYETKVSNKEYAGLFSRLHANELIFSAKLSLAVKQAAARRMLAYPATLDKEPLLRFTLERLADDTPLNRALYYLVWPLGKLWTLVLELQDHWQTILVIWAQPQLNPAVPHQPAVINWPEVEAKAEQEQIMTTNNNPYGFDNEFWFKYSSQPLEDSGIRAAMARMDLSAEWSDLEILLRVLQELGARPLIISRPINAVYWGEVGVSAATRQVYYDKLNQAAKSYNVPMIDFREHEADKYFSTDMLSHTSRKGWVYVDKVLDDFYHDALR